MKNLDFVAIKGAEDSWVLSQIDGVESHPDGKTIANCDIIGVRKGGTLLGLKTPVKPSSLVYSADKKIIQETLDLPKGGIYLGKLDANKDVPVFVDAGELVSKHLCVLAQTGSGKSYVTGVIVEELLEKKIPVIVIDSHGEYVSLGAENQNPKEIEKMQDFGISPKAYRVREYSTDSRVNPGAEQITFSDKNLEATEIASLFPAKASASQTGVLYAAVLEAKRKGEYNLADIIEIVGAMEGASKWTVINMLEVVRATNLFTDNPTPLKDIVKPGSASIINLRGASPEIQQVVVHRLVEKLFEQRKIGRVPPLFLIVEEAHNFCPEKEVRMSSKILRTVASEGRKFGFGLCIVSQRPARVDKNILSQCNTQVILRVTNPNDLKAIAYAEGINKSVEKEIRNLSTGTALMLGREVPLFVNVRVKRTKHGGVTVSVTDQKKAIDTVLSFDCLEQAAFKKYGKIKKVYYPIWLIKSAGGENFIVDGIKGRLMRHEKGWLAGAPVEFSEANTASLKSMKGAAKVEYPTKIVAADGELLPFKVLKMDIAGTASAVFGKTASVKEAYYPYFVGQNVMIDGVTGTVRDAG